MIRINSLGVSAALLALACLPGTVAAQSLKQTIVGSWSYVSVYDQYADGTKNNPWGEKPRGTLMFDANGRFSQILLGQPSADMKTPDPRRPDTLTVAYFGTYTVDEAAKKVSIKIEAAAYSGRSGTESSWTVSGSGDKLSLVGAPRQDQKGSFSPQIEVQRAK